MSFHSHQVSEYEIHSLSLVDFAICDYALFADKNPPLNVKVDVQPVAAEVGMPLVSYADVLGEATPSVVAVYTSRIVMARQSYTLPEIYRQFGRSIPRATPEEG